MKRILIYIAIVCALAGVIWAQHAKIDRLTGERDRYRENTDVLLGDVQTYRTRDSLSAAKVGALELRLSEVERYRAADLALIEQLKARTRDLQAYATTQTQTIAELRGQFRDSIVYVDRIVPDTVRVLNIATEWFDLHGRLQGDEFEGTMRSRDSLLIATTVEYRRFLGFLWRTRKIKNKEVSVTSRNPHTEIVGVEYIEVTIK